MGKLATIAFSGLVVVGCAGPGTSPRSPVAPDDLLLLRSAGGITLVPTAEGEPAIRLPGAVPALDWSAMVRAVPLVDGSGEPATRVIGLDPDGAEVWSRDLDGSLEVKVVSQEGRLTALGPDGRGRKGYPIGRASTRLVLVGELGEPRTITLPGNYEPEAFSTDGRSLFVIRYLPPMRPTHYQVRRLDLETERVVGVYTADGHLQESMQGTARIQAASADGTRLYTLYTLFDPRGVQRAFVHVLSLDDLWAHCINLPDDFSYGNERTIALSVTPDGERLYAADSSGGTVAEIDTERLSVVRSGRVELDSRGGLTQALAGPGGTLHLAKGTQVVTLDMATLLTTSSRETDARITGLQAARDGGRLYVGLQDEILVLSTQSGLQLGTLDPENLDTIVQLGRATRWLEEARTEFTCAC